MNEDTLIVVHCYAGDKEQVENALPVHLRHRRPVLILSPEDAPVEIEQPGVTWRAGGKRGYYGQDSLDRQVIHLKMLLETPYRYFLLNDSDSVCLSPEIPRYLYEGAENTVWSNVVREGRPHASPYPKIAFHPPYFVTRETIERLLSVADGIKAHEITPFIDWFMVAMTCEAGLEYRSFPDGKSFPAWRHGYIPVTLELGHDYVHENKDEGKDGGRRMAKLVQQGVVMVHSVKHKPVLDALVRSHEHFRMIGSPADLLPKPDPVPYGGISLLVPFREDSTGTRTSTWKWLEAYYRESLPEAEIIIGEDDGTPYSKSTAINDAAARAMGYVLVILDADVLIDPDVIRQCASKIEKASRPVWFIPFTRAYRLTQERGLEIQEQDPEKFRPLGPSRQSEIEDMIDGAPGFIHILSRRAFNKVRGMDPRFRGWGGEDTSFVHAVDTLYGKHTRTANHITHLWHERPGAGSSSSRRWDGQTERKRELWTEYKQAAGDKVAMKKIVDSRES